MDEQELPNGWARWHTQPDGICVFTFHPDVFDGTTFPPACLPTIAVKPQRSRGSRGRPRHPNTAKTWEATLLLEPDVIIRQRTAASREEAITIGFEFATAFNAGELDLRSAYAEPNEAYLERVNELIEKEE